MKKNIFFIVLLVMTVGSMFAQTPGDFIKTPSISWTFKTSQPIFSSPVTSNGLAIFGGLDSTLYALDIRTGKERWKLKTNGAIRSSVIVHEEKVFLAGGNGVVTCISLENGKLLWRSILDPTAVFLGERSYDFADYYHSTPTIIDDKLIVGSGSTRLFALSILDGALQWAFKAGDIIHSNAVVTNGKIYFGCFDGYVYSIDAKDGELMWKFKTIGHQYFPNGEVQGSPVVANGNVFVGARDYNFYAINQKTGHASWNMKFQRGWALSAPIQDSVLYIGTSDDRVLIAIDSRYGNELWRTDVKYNVFGGCAFSNGVVYVGTIWGKLYALDKSSGRILWSFETPGHLANRSRYYKADGVFRDDIESILKSPPQWIAAEYKMGGIFSTPVLSDDMLIVTCTDGVVYGLKR